MFRFTAREKQEAVEREVKQRIKVYGRLVHEKKMTNKFADNQIAIMQEIADDYRKLADDLDKIDRLIP